MPIHHVFVCSGSASGKAKLRLVIIGKMSASSCSASFSQGMEGRGMSESRMEGRGRELGLNLTSGYSDYGVT